MMFLLLIKIWKKSKTLANEVTHVVQADTTDEEALRSLGILNFDVVIVLSVMILKLIS